MSNVRPMRASAGGAPQGGGWAVEFAWDGVRVLVATGPDGVAITGDEGDDLTGAYPELARLGDGRELLLDGVIVVLDPHGRPDAGLLGRRTAVPAPDEDLLDAAPVTLFLVDVLSVDGEELTDRPYDERRGRLEGLDAGSWPRVTVPASFTDAAPAEVLEVAHGHGLPGIVSKRRTSGYEPGRRSSDWIRTPVPDAPDEAGAGPSGPPRRPTRACGTSR